MSSRLDTLLLITQDLLVRAGLRDGRVADVSQEPRPAADDLPSLVEAALRLGRRRVGRVWLLTSDCWTQTLSLPREAVSRLKAVEVDRALAFEAEPFSGLAALESALGHVRLADSGDQALFWLSALSAVQVEEVEDVVHHARGRLLGISHPGGVGRPFTPDAAASGWQRVELWPGAVIRVRRSAEGPGDVLVRNTDPRLGRWEEETERWRDEAPALAFEGWHACATGKPDRPEWLSLGDPPGRSALLQAWADELGASEPAVPLLRPPKRPMSVGVRRAVTAGLALAAVAACAVVQLATGACLESLGAETRRLQAPAQQLAQLKKDGEGLHKREDELQKSCQKLESDIAQCQTALRQQRLRLASLLEVLNHDCPEELVVQRIDGSAQGMILHGIALRPDLVDGLAASLARTLTPLGWHVQPAAKHSRDQLSDAGPWAFEMEVCEAP